MQKATRHHYSSFSQVILMVGDPFPSTTDVKRLSEIGRWCWCHGHKCWCHWNCQTSNHHYQLGTSTCCFWILLTASFQHHFPALTLDDDAMEFCPVQPPAKKTKCHHRMTCLIWCPLGIAWWWFLLHTAPGIWLSQFYATSSTSWSWIQVSDTHWRTSNTWFSDSEVNSNDDSDCGSQITTMLVFSIRHHHLWMILDCIQSKSYVLARLWT